MTLSTNEWSVLTWILAYLGVAFVVFSAWCSAFRSPRCRLGDEDDLIMAGVPVALLWPLSVPCFVIAGIWILVQFLLDWIRSRRCLRWLPDWDDCHPLDWVFCWPGNIARHIEGKMWERRRIQREKEREEERKHDRKATEGQTERDL